MSTAPDAPPEKIETAPDAKKIETAPDAENPTTATAEEATKKPEEPVLPPVSWRALFRYADGWDIFMYVVGGFFAVVSGAGMPAFSELFGRLINALTDPANLESEVNNLALIMVYVGIGRMIVGFFAIAFFMVPCERQTSRIRGLYVDALLRQEMGFHDTAKSGSLTAALVGDIQIYRNGTND